VINGELLVSFHVFWIIKECSEILCCCAVDGVACARVQSPTTSKVSHDVVFQGGRWHKRQTSFETTVDRAELGDRQKYILVYFSQCSSFFSSFANLSRYLLASSQNEKKIQTLT
jgi:hypothetical protein